MKKNVSKIVFFVALLALVLVVVACTPTATKYTITYENDGEVYHTTKTAGNKTLKLPAAPTKEGYDFDGWFFDNGVWENEFSASTYAKKALTEDVKVYAKWTRVYAVKFMNDDTLWKTVSVEENASVTEPKDIIKKQGYEFVEWLDKNESTWDFDSIVTEDTVLYAKWSPIQYTISLDADGGILSENNTKIHYDSVFILSVPVKDDYYFDGWFYGEQKLTDNSGNGLNIWNISNDITLMAHYHKHEYGDWSNYTQATCVEQGIEIRKCVFCDSEEYRFVYANGHNFADGMCLECQKLQSTLGSSFENAFIVIESGDYLATFNGESMYYFRINALRNGTLTIYSSSSVDTYGYLYDNLNHILKQDDDSGSGNNFSFTYRLTIGSVYYAGVRFYNNSINGSFKVHINFVWDCEHSYDDWATTQEPTCTETGIQERVCTICGNIETADIEAHGHEYGDWATTQEPTCTETGIQERVCTICGNIETADIEAHGHEYGDWATTQEPTCTETGIQERICEICTEKEIDVLEILDHSLEDGICLDCGNEFLYIIINDANYPFEMKEGIFVSTNKTHYSTASYTISTETGCRVSFEYKVSGYYQRDWFYIYYNNETKVRSSENDYIQFSITLNAGDTLTFSYYKSSYDISGDSGCYIKDLAINAKQLFYSNIIFDKQEGNGGSDRVRAIIGREMPSAIAPTMTGYTFKGYFDSLEDGVQYYTADMQSVKNWDKEDDTTLYAIWEPTVYTIIFEKQGGTGGAYGVEALYNEEMKKSIAPSKDGYVFVGYFDAVSGGKKYYNGAMDSVRVWDKTTDGTLYARWAIYESGFGTDDSPFVITNSSQLAFFDGHEGVYFELANDIDLNGVEWSPLSTFSGILDGKGHKIHNFKITNAKSGNWGLFSNVNGTIRNTGLEDFYIDINSEMGYAGLNVGGFSGFGGNYENCYTTGNITVSLFCTSGQSGISVGGITGEGGSFIKCYTTGNISNTARTGNQSSGGALSYAGGLTGETAGEIIQCYTNGNVTAYAKHQGRDTGFAKSYAGGLVGYCRGSVLNSYAKGAITATSETYYNAYSYAGGLIGYNYSTIDNSYSLGNVAASAIKGWLSTYNHTFDAYAGGLVGYRYSGAINNCFAVGQIYASSAENDAYRGSLVGSGFRGSGSYNYDGQNISDDQGTKASKYLLNTPDFYTDILNWDTGIWNILSLNFDNGLLPTLVPKVEIIDVTVILDVQGGESIDPMVLSFGDEYGILPTPIKYGYIFAGWWTMPNGTGKEVTEEVIVERGDHILYAKWVAVSNIEVTFDLQGGDGQANSIYITFDGPYGTLAGFPSKEGYIFNGWWTEPNGQGENIVTSSIVTKAESHTLYASWIPIE